MKKSLSPLYLLLFVGCLISQPSAPPEPKHKIPPVLLDKIAALDEADQMPVLTAVHTLVTAGFFDQYVWTPPTTGTPAVKYNVEHWFDVGDESFYFLNTGKHNIATRVRGVDAAGVAGPWSVISDTSAVKQVW